MGEVDRKAPGSDGSNPFSQLIEDAEGLDKIEALQEHQNEELYEKAVTILETYFDAEEGEDQNLAPAAGQVGALRGLGALCSVGRAVTWCGLAAHQKQYCRSSMLSAQWCALMRPQWACWRLVASSIHTTCSTPGTGQHSKCCIASCLLLPLLLTLRRLLLLLLQGAYAFGANVAGQQQGQFNFMGQGGAQGGAFSFQQGFAGGQ